VEVVQTIMVQVYLQDAKAMVTALQEDVTK